MTRLEEFGMLTDRGNRAVKALIEKASTELGIDHPRSRFVFLSAALKNLKDEKGFDEAMDTEVRAIGVAELEFLVKTQLNENPEDWRKYV